MKTNAQLFCELANITLDEYNNKPTIGGSLNLYSTAITELPKGLTVGGSLYLYSTAITELPKGLTVGGSLYLHNTAIISLPEGLTVGGDLDLRNTAITELPEGLTIGGSLNLYSTAITELPKGLTVGGGLNLDGTAITSLPEGLTVGSWLDLCGTAITSLPEGQTVGGSLYLHNTAIISLPEGLTVGGKIYTYDGKIIAMNNAIPLLSWQDGKYIKADGIFTEVVNHKDNVYRVRRIGKAAIEYLITDGKGNYAHGSTLSEAKEDLIYKCTDRKKSDYEHLTLDSVLTHDEAVICYRVITGACRRGVRYFVKEILNGNRKPQYTIAAIAALTNGQYRNNEFKQFFTK